MNGRVRPWLIVLALAGPHVVQAQQAQGERFDHSLHRRFFPSCTSCHVAPARGEGRLYPDSATCAACHDGTTERRVVWHPPSGPRATNLRFDHALVPIMIPAGASEPPGCTVCHAEPDQPWMAVERVSMTRCLSCHGVTTAHLAAPDSACTVCHHPLHDATQLTRADVAQFPVPPSHRDAGWVSRHGSAARGATGAPVAAACTICHAREFCVQCHVDAPERPLIQALPSDPRATAIVVQLKAPASHSEPTFATTHGGMARRTPAECATCHARESCLTCHSGTPRVATFLPVRAPGRAVGAVIQRHRPAFHGQDFAQAHAALAAGNSKSCTGCHVRADCLTCHRPDPGAAPRYHPVDYLARHPADAYSRASSCADCHNTAGFCADCHLASGLTATGPLRGGYHDANAAFIAGHGQAARQSLETCTACHAERDCLPCHSANGGRHYNPHGPGFNADQLKRKNPQMCTVCHGTAIPTQ